MKKLVAILLAALLMCSLAVSAGAIIPFFGISSLTVTQDGKPVAGIAVDLYRVNHGEDQDDTLVGSYVTQEDGTVTSARLIRGDYCWRDSSWNIEQPFTVIGGRLAWDFVELPTNLNKTFAVDEEEYGVSGEVTISVDLTGRWMGEINDYGTLYLYKWLDGQYLLGIGFTDNQEKYEGNIRSNADNRIEGPDGLDVFFDDDEYGGTDCFLKIADGVYYHLWLELGMDLEEVLSRVEITSTIDNAADLPAPTDDGRENMTYMSPDGFQIRFNALKTEAREIGDHSAEFVYLGEPDGANKVTVSWIADKQPEEVLYEVTSEWGDQETIRRSEGLFPGTDDKWGYWRVLTDDETVRVAIAGEYNNGVLLFEIESRLTGDDAEGAVISDTLAEIIDSITYFDFGAQTMYAYIPGVYEATDESGAVYQVVLNEDHTGTLRLQDSVDVLWGSIELIAPDASYAYTVEGENLYVELDGVWVEFVKQIEG